MLPPGVVDRDPALAAFHEHHARHDQYSQHADTQQHQDRNFALPCLFERLPYRPGEAGHDTGENQYRNAIADTPFGHLFTQPHQKHRAGDQRRHRDEVKRDIAGVRKPLGGEAAAHGDTLYGCQQQCPVTRILLYLAPPGVAFLAQLLQRRRRRDQKLRDDRRGNIGHDAQRENTHPLQGAAREHVEQIEDTALLLFEQRPQPLGIDPRHGYMTANPIHDDREQDIEQPSPELGQAPARRCKRLRPVLYQ